MGKKDLADVQRTKVKKNIISMFFFSIFSVLLFDYFSMQNNKMKGFLMSHEFGCFVFVTPAQITFCEGAE